MMATSTLTDDRADIIAAVDLVALWPSLVGPQGRNRQWPCPNPNHGRQTGKTPPVSINPKGTLWHCHGCNAGGTILDALMLATGCDIAEAFTYARRLAGLVDRDHHRGSVAGLTGRPRHRGGDRTGTPRAAFTPAKPDGDRITGDEAETFLAAYLDHRQWPTEVVDVFGLHVVADGRGRLRVRHPYRVADRTVWWQDRGTGDPKWFSPKGGHRMLYAADLAATLDTGPPNGYPRPVRFVVEGPADVIAMWCTAPAAATVGLPGTAGAGKWAESFTGADVLIATDADDAGDRAAVELGDALAPHDARWARLRPPEGCDIDEWRRQIGDEELRTALVDVLDREVWS